MVGEVVQLMADKGRGSVVIVDAKGALLGIFTERDVKHRLDFSDESWRSIPVGDRMTREPATVRGSTTFTEALAVMRDGQRRHVPIVDEQGRVEGVLSIRDLLRMVARAYPEQFINLAPTPDHEASSRWGG